MPPGFTPSVFTPSVVTVLFLAVVLFFLARILRGTLFGGIVRGLAVALLAMCAVTVASGLLLKSGDVARILDLLLPAVTVCLVVLFQPEIRRALLRVRGPFAGPPGSGRPPALDEVLRALERLSREKRGALVAWERAVGLGEFIATGVAMDAEARAETIVTIFAPDTPLHDGALILRGERMAAAACVLPVGEGNVPPPAGLRHRAALGLVEQTDAVVVVLSEETGQVSLAADGRLETLKDAATLGPRLAALLGEPR